VACYLHNLVAHILASVPVAATNPAARPLQQGGTMENHIENQIPTTTSGIDRLVEKYRRQFRIPENLNHYTEADFQHAEREYLRFCLGRGNC
jgi:hypothetical protein